MHRKSTLNVSPKGPSDPIGAAASAGRGGGRRRYTGQLRVRQLTIELPMSVESFGPTSDSVATPPASVFLTYVACFFALTFLIVSPSHSQQQDSLPPVLCCLLPAKLLDFTLYVHRMIKGVENLSSSHRPFVDLVRNQISIRALQG